MNFAVILNVELFRLLEKLSYGKYIADRKRPNASAMVVIVSSP